MTMKVYATVSARRATTDIKACVEDGYMTRAPHYNSVLAYFDKAEMTSILTGLIEQSSKQLATVETKFAVDSTNFSMLNAHAMVGVATNIITAISVTDISCADPPWVSALLDSETQRLEPAEQSTFAAIKKKFGGFVRSKRFTAQANEVLCKALCHNLAMIVLHKTTSRLDTSEKL
jgi:hypothetical protein